MAVSCARLLHYHFARQYFAHPSVRDEGRAKDQLFKRTLYGNFRLVRYGARSLRYGNPLEHVRTNRHSSAHPDGRAWVYDVRLHRFFVCAARARRTGTQSRHAVVRRTKLPRDRYAHQAYHDRLSTYRIYRRELALYQLCAEIRRHGGVLRGVSFGVGIL